MRWSDRPGELPRLPEPEPSPLARRLGALPDGHPSSPGYAADSEVADSQPDVADGLADGAAQARADDDQGYGDPADGELADGELADGGDATAAEGLAGAAGRHPASRIITRVKGEPYRPWFTAGEPSEPWFTAGPGGPPG